MKKKLHSSIRPKLYFFAIMKVSESEFRWQDTLLF